jgi:hypothetical protein
MQSILLNNMLFGVAPELNPEGKSPKHERRSQSDSVATVFSTEDRKNGTPATLPAGTASRPYQAGEPTRLALGKLADDYVADTRTTCAKSCEQLRPILAKPAQQKWLVFLN